MPRSKDRVSTWRSVTYGSRIGRSGWKGETGAALGVDAWVDVAETWADGLARQAGPHEAALRKDADRRLVD
ncbi:MAG: hypothetical protein ACR2FE_10930 [Aeromicrobium sp.]